MGAVEIDEVLATGRAALVLPVQRVFITENETNFLAFPPAADAIAVFGAGYGWEALARVSWLHRCQLHWGEEPDPARHDLARLTPGEAAVYDDLRFGRLQPGLRLEQERVGFGWLSERLAAQFGVSTKNPPTSGRTL